VSTPTHFELALAAALRNHLPHECYVVAMERLKGIGEAYDRAFPDQTAQRIAELERENAMLLKDKERYEWLKDGKGSHWAYNYLRDNFRINDDAIDAARNEGGAT
jgi:hypothetical protein